MRVHLTHLGCKLNQAEIERLGRQFEVAGHRVVGSLAEADLHVVNSCTVTHTAARTSRKAAGRGSRRGLRTVLTGCYTEDPTAAAHLAGVDLVVPNREKDRLLERVHAAFPEDNDVTPQPASHRHPECEPCEREGSGRADPSVPQILWVAEAPRRMTSGTVAPNSEMKAFSA